MDVLVGRDGSAAPGRPSEKLGEPSHCAVASAGAGLNRGATFLTPSPLLSDNHTEIAPTVRYNIRTRPYYSCSWYKCTLSVNYRVQGITGYRVLNLNLLDPADTDCGNTAVLRMGLVVKFTTFKYYI